MKIAMITDTHLGYARFDEDAFVQAQNAFSDAVTKADIILFAGDMFDTKIPKLETLASAVEIVKHAKEKGIPIFAIHGNHERRTKDTLNPLQLLARVGLVTYLHNRFEIFEKNGEMIQVFGLGSIPEEFALTAMKGMMKNFCPTDNAFRILLIHQTVHEMLSNNDQDITLDYLETLPFDLIVNGHHHGKTTKIENRFIMPGSTVITKLKKEESEQKGYGIYDTAKKTYEFVPIVCRKLFYERLDFNDAAIADIKKAVQEKVESIRKTDKNAIIAIKLEGSLKDGLQTTDIKFETFENVFIDNRLNFDSLATKLEKIRNLREEKLSVRELALNELINKMRSKVTLFDPAELFEKLIEGSDEAVEYLQGTKNK